MSNHRSYSNRYFASIVVGVTLVGGCTIIAGLDGDYVEGPLGDGGTTSNGGSAGTTSNGGDPVGPSSGGNPSQSGGGPGNGGGGEGGSGGMGGVGGSGGAPLMCPSGQHTYAAVVAECINPGNPVVATCNTQAGANVSVVSSDSGGNPYTTFFRFDLDADVAAGPFSSAQLRVRTGPNTNDGGVSSGEVWRVDPFTAMSLTGTAPANADAAARAAAMAVASNTTYTIDLSPTTNLVEGVSVYLAVRPINDNGGDDVRYIDVPGNDEPTLILVCP